MTFFVEDLLDDARAATGLEDFGEASFRNGLEVLVASINGESQFTQVGAAAARSAIVANLVNLLQIEDCYRRHPEIEEQQIAAPLFIVGLPRTGGTSLGQMLATHPANRSLLAWEVMQPCPPPDPASVASDPRIDLFRARMEEYRNLAPGTWEALPVHDTMQAECFFLLDMAFASAAVDANFHVPSYIKWVITPNLPEIDAAYRYHRRILKLLQWRMPPRQWVLRAPVHSFSMEALDRVYPDARFVMTHRAAEKAIPSVALLMHYSRETLLGNAEPASFGPMLVDRWQEAMRRLLAFRDRVGEDRFFDIAHRDQIIDPTPGIRALYASLGWDFNGMEARISTWRHLHPKGNHRPDPAFFGMNVDDIRRRFAFYHERFVALL
jgi:hypothetical protein